MPFTFLRPKGKNGEIPRQASILSQLSADLTRVASSGSVYFIAAMAQRGVAFLLLPVYTRLISPARYGILEVLTTVASLAFGLLMLGLPSAVNKCYHRDCDTKEEQSQVLPTAAWLATPILVAGTALLWLQAPLVSQLLLGSPAHSGLVKLAVLGGMFSNLNALMLSGLRSQERALAFGLISVVQFSITMLLNLYFVVVLKLDITGVFWGNLLGAALVLPITFMLASHRTRLSPNLSLAKPLLSFGILILPATIGGWVIDLSDRYLLTKLASLDQVGVYGVGYKIGMIIQLAIVSPFQLSWPAVSFSISTKPYYKQTYARTLTYLSIILAYGTVLLSIASRLLIPHIFGEDFVESYRVVPLVAMAYCLNGVLYCVSPALHIAEKTRLLSILTVLAASLNVTLNVLAIPRFGMMGAAWTTVLAFLVLAAGALAMGQRYNPVPYEYGRLSKVICVATAIYLLSLVTPATLTLGSIVWHTTLALMGVPAGLLGTGFLEPSERARLKALLSLADFRKGK